MNLFGTIGRSFVKIFFTNDGFLKHACLFALTGIISVGSTYFQSLSENMKANGTPPDISSLLGTIVIWIIAAIIISVYLSGYNLKFMHNSFDDESNSVMPDFDANPFAVFCKAFPLIFVWALYIIILYILCGVMFVMPLKILGALMGLVLLFYVPFICFVNIAYVKNFDRSGLFNMFLPFKYMSHSIGWVILCGLLFIPMVLLIMVPPFIVGVIAGIAGLPTNAAMFAGGVIGGYLGTILQLMWLYCAVQIYREKIEPNL